MFQNIQNRIKRFFNEDDSTERNVVNTELPESEKNENPNGSINWEEKYAALEEEKQQVEQRLEEQNEKVEDLESKIIDQLLNKKHEGKKGKIQALKQPIDYSFYSEVMVTAGPRKELKRDVDYGEDTCGVVHTKDKILFWLLDGASNQDSFFLKVNEIEHDVEMFSSRLMVQSISKVLPEVFRDDNTLDAQMLAEKAVSRVIEEWVARFEKFKSNVVEVGSLKCATTMIIGTLDLKGKLDAFVIGDSKLLLFDDKNEIKGKSMDSEKHQVFVAAVDNEQLKVYTSNKDRNRIEGKLVRGQHIKEKSVYSIICHSDGISERRSRKIQEKSNEGFVVVRDALSKIPVNTQDDKSLLIVELKND